MTTMVERARAEVEAQLQKTHDTKHRAIDRTYNLLRVSERRWQVIRVGSVAERMFQHEDVITFESVSKPLPFEAALAELEKRRA